MKYAPYGWNGHLHELSQYLHRDITNELESVINLYELITNKLII